VAWDGSLKIADTFGVTAGGVLTATGATISGNITATDLVATQKGTIGGWTISQSALTGGDISLNSAGSITVTDVCTINSDGVAIHKGSITLKNDNGTIFEVTNAGKVTIREGDITLGGTADEPVFSVNSDGIVNITKGSISLGKNENFKVTDTGVVTIREGNITLGGTVDKPVFSVNSSGIVNITQGSITLGEDAGTPIF
jgi:hypothetical protein